MSPFLLVVMLAAAGPAPGPSRPTPDDLLADARGLQDQGRNREALRALKSAVRAHPDHEPLHHALARAYLDDNNAFWALKVLSGYAVAHPPACATRALVAHVHYQQANLTQAVAVLEEEGCDGLGPNRARLFLVRAQVLRQRQDRPDARRALAEARRSGAFYEEDLPLLAVLEQDLEPARLPVASWSLDTRGGWTSNALAGSPGDPATDGGGHGSPLATLDTRFRLVMPTPGPVRPTVEATWRAQAFAFPDARPLTYQQPGLRTGLLLGGASPRLLVAYAWDALQLLGGDRYDDGPLWFSDAHRLEYELEVGGRLFVFGGAGVRRFREMSRTRGELEQGIATSWRPLPAVRLVVGASGRAHVARLPAYAAVGATLLGQVFLSPAGGWEARVGGSTSYDHFPHSQDHFGLTGDDVRQELLTRGTAGLWSASVMGLRVGVEVESAARTGTARRYEYAETRALLRLSWALDSDRAWQFPVWSRGRVPLRHDVKRDPDGSGEDVRIRDLVRQDESVQRGSTCLK